MQETQETCVPSLGWEDALEKDMATHLLLLGNPMDRGVSWLQSALQPLLVVAWGRWLQLLLPRAPRGTPIHLPEVTDSDS